MNETTEQKPLTKHMKAAVNQLQKQSEVLFKKRVKKQAQIDAINVEIDDLINSERFINEQISKLKGE